MYILWTLRRDDCDPETLKSALLHTAEKRGSTKVLERYEAIMEQIKTGPELQGFWSKYTKEYDYAKDITFDSICRVILEIMNSL